MKQKDIYHEINALVHKKTFNSQNLSSLFYNGKNFIICHALDIKPGYTMIWRIEFWMFNPDYTESAVERLSELSTSIINEFRKDN